MKIFLSFILISMSINCYSQFTIDSFYKDKSTLLITSKVINLDGKLKNDIKSGFKNCVLLSI